MMLHEAQIIATLIGLALVPLASIGDGRPRRPSAWARSRDFARR